MVVSLPGRRAVSEVLRPSADIRIMLRCAPYVYLEGSPSMLRCAPYVLVMLRCVPLGTTLGKKSDDDDSPLFEVVARFRLENGRLIPFDVDESSVRREGCRNPSPPAYPGGSRSGCVPPSRVPAAPSSSSGEPTQVSHSGSSWQSPGWLHADGTPFTTPEIPPGTKCPCGNFARGMMDGLCNACWWEREREAT